MKLRSKDIIAALVGAFGYKLERIRKPGKASTTNSSITPDYLPSDPYQTQTQLIKQLGLESPVIFDVGANKGDTVFDYRKLFKDASIHCFEPFPEMIEVLKSRFSQDSKIQIVPKAVSEHVDQATFYVNKAHATNSLLPQPNDSQRYYQDQTQLKDEITIDTTTLDTYCAQNAIEHINILKLDIQGAELKAVAGASTLFKENRIDIVYCEIQFVPLYEGSAQFDQLWSAMRNLNYSLLDIYDIHRSAGGQILFGDAIFISPKCQEKTLDLYRIDK